MIWNSFSKMLKFAKDGGCGLAWGPSPCNLTLWAASLGKSNGVRMRKSRDNNPYGYGRHQATMGWTQQPHFWSQGQWGCPGPKEEIWVDSEHHWGESTLAFTQHHMLSSLSTGWDHLDSVGGSTTLCTQRIEMQLGLPQETYNFNGMRQTEGEQIGRSHQGIMNGFITPNPGCSASWYTWGGNW